jgi:methylmalonyl-CoA/ethylmalonyl-CoA epimerase
MNIKRIDHVAIAVPDIAEALGFFQTSLGLRVDRTDFEAGQGVKIAFMPVGETEMELVEPVESDSGVARFLEKRGPGIHHICLEVEDLDAALATMRANGAQLINEVPYTTNCGRRIAFIHPKSSFGVLIELYEAVPGVLPA